MVGDGLEGDIALDDLAVLDGNCKSISRQGRGAINGRSCARYRDLFPDSEADHDAMIFFTTISFNLIKRKKFTFCFS